MLCVNEGWRFSGWMAALGLAVLVGGCEQPDWDNPEYIADKLKNGSSTERKKALDKYDAVKEDLSMEARKKTVGPALAEVYLNGGAYQKKAMQFLVSTPSPGAKEAYLQELENDTAGYAGGAAEALGQTQAKKAIPDLLKLYQSTGDNDMKIAILRGLQHMPTPKMVQPLAKTLRQDVDNNPIPLHSYACEILGDIAEQKPNALDEDVRRAVVRGMFLSNKKGQTTKQECSIAVQKIGKPAESILVETFKGENTEVQKLFLKYRKDAPKKFPPNRSRVVATQRLTSMQSEKAPQLYIDYLKSEPSAPEDLQDSLYAPWRTYDANARDEMIFGLGDLRVEKGSELLTDILTGEYNDDYESIFDPLSELQLRQDAAFALVRLGNREATDVLLEMAEEGVVEPLEKRAKALEKSERAKPMPIDQRYQFNWMTAKAYAALATGDDLEAYKSMIDSWDGEDLKPLREKLESFVPMIEKAGECLGKNSKGAQAKCWGKALSSESEHVREKAAWELTRLPKKVAGKTITEHLDTEHLGAREVLSLGLYHNPHEPAIDKIGKILEKEADESGDGYELDHYRLKLLRAWLKNHFS